MKVAGENANDHKDYAGSDGTGWVCDHCKQQIKTAGDGWLQAITVLGQSGGDKMRDLALVHHITASPRRVSHRYDCPFDGNAV